MNGEKNEWKDGWTDGWGMGRWIRRQQRGEGMDEWVVGGRISAKKG